MEIKIGKRGLIKKGEQKGWYVLIQDDAENTGGFLILTAKSPEMASGEGYDSWVENISVLEDYIEESQWEIEWLE